MPHPRPALLAAASQVLLCFAGSAGPAAWAQGAPVLNLLRVEFLGGSGDDHRFAHTALGLHPGRPVSEDELAAGLAAVRLTDRFLEVRGRFRPESAGSVAMIELTPVPALRGWEVEGSLPVPVPQALFPGLRKGSRVGDLRLEQFRQTTESRLRELGYPRAQVSARRGTDPTRLQFSIQPGPPDLIRRMRLDGEAEAYGADRLLKLLKAEPGKTLWTQDYRREALARLRKRFVKDKRFQGQAELTFAEDGTLVLSVDPGPVVRLASEGPGFGWFKSLKDLVPLGRAERYSPELLDAGARSIVRFLRAKGYLDAEVSHRTDVIRGSQARPDEIRVTYLLAPGERLTAAGVRFERNLEISSAELERVASLPSTWLGLFPEPWTPSLIAAVENRIKFHYQSRGYADIALRKLPLEGRNGKGTLVFQVREGSRRFLEALVLEVPSDPSYKAWFLAESLVSVFADQPRLVGLDSESVRRYVSDRPGMAGIQGTLQELEPKAGAEVRRFRFAFGRPIPLLKSDLAQALGVLNQRVASLGILKPAAHGLHMEAGTDGTVAHISVAAQPLARMGRVVVQGSDATRARAVLREIPLEEGVPMDPERISRLQGRVGNLGGFDQVDLMPLREASETGPAFSWKDGDLLLRVRERSPWIFSSGFGYDKSQGYHLDLGAQRLNVSGMGRTLDFGLRAGDSTLRNPTLRKWFPTGEFTRSVDMYRVGYTDPWFAPGFLGSLLPDRTLFTAEGAYIEEQRSAYLLRRRRAQAALEWDLDQGLVVQVGYRFERNEVRWLPDSGIPEVELGLVARTPGRAVISAPFVQVVRDRRDNRLDPTSGSFSVARFEFANQAFGTSANASFVKLDLRQQWNWPLGYKASHGVVSLGLRAGVARPTASTAEDLPLSERFFAGGPGTHRGLEPDSLGAIGYVHPTDSNGNTRAQAVPLGGQGLLLGNLEYRFPMIGSTVWGEVFVDSGQVYQSLRDTGQVQRFPPLRTSLGMGLILKVGIPIKVEYAVDAKRILGRPRTELEKDTQLKSLLISAGFQF